MKTEHTFNCTLPGYEVLLLTVDLGMTSAQIDHSIRQGGYSPALVDFPNWDEAAAALGLTRTDSENGEVPTPKPDLPLDAKRANVLPLVLIRYLSDNTMINDALTDYMEARSPNLKRR